MGSSFFGWFERSSLWCPGRKPWVTERCVWSSVWREQNIFWTSSGKLSQRLNPFMQCLMPRWLFTNWVMWGSVKETSFCCIFEIYQVKSKSFSSCIRTLWPYNSWKQESRTITSELESKVTWDQCMLHSLCRKQIWRTKPVSIVERKVIWLRIVRNP